MNRRCPGGRAPGAPLATWQAAFEPQDDFTLGRLRGAYEVAIQAYESHPIARDLGLGAGPLRPLASVYADFDFVMEAGHELWRAGA